MELMVVMTLVTILMGSAVSNIKNLDKPLDNAVNETLGFIKQVRSRAMSSTLAYKILPESATRIKVQYSTDCSATMVNDNTMFLDLPETTSLSATNWNACFSPRGLAAATLSFSIRNNAGASKSIEIVLGGAARPI